MDIKSKKSLLEIYGLLRMTLGVAELVGLLSAYFLLEFVIKYPSQLSLYLVDEDIVFFTVFVVLLRGIFHVITGIGIARLQHWGRWWIFCGWPVMLVMTYSVVYNHYHDWSTSSYVTSFGEVLNFGKLILYLVFIGFDVFFVSGVIKEFNEKQLSIKIDVGERLENKNIAIFFGLAIVFFLALIFLGRPIKQGFHPGFYKSHGEKASSGKRSDVVKNAPREIKSENPLSSDPKADSPADIILAKQTKIEQMMIDEKKIVPEEHVAVKPERMPKEKGMAYRTLFGVAALVFIVAGLLLQISQMVNNKVSSFGFILLSIGFFVLLIYGVGMKQNVVSAIGFFAGLLSAVIVLLNSKNRN